MLCESRGRRERGVSRKGWFKARVRECKVSQLVFALVLYSGEKWSSLLREYGKVLEKKKL